MLACAYPAHAADDPWAASYDAATQTRYIPVELILGARWSGQREITLPAGSFTEGVARDPSTWQGPSAWQHPDTGAALMVYDRTRRGVRQKFAVRTDGTAIGRVADNRYGISSCDQEAKYPLGVWKQGETRDFLHFLRRIKYDHRQCPQNGGKSAQRHGFIHRCDPIFRLPGKAVLISVSVVVSNVRAVSEVTMVGGLST